jgi:peptidase E
MNKYIFHGGCSTQENNDNTTFFAEVVKEIPKDGTLLLVYFAARNDDYTERIAFDSRKYRNATDTDFNIEVATRENFIHQVKDADCIYLRGGSTEKLINTLKEYPEFRSALKNKSKTVAGSSAGAYALSTYFSSHYKNSASDGLGIVPVRVITHFESEKMPPKAGAVETLKNTAAELPLIILKEAEWEIFCSA